jgi:hypothetical protein
MMRGSLSNAFRQGIHEAARGLEFEFYYHFFDAIFLASFLIAAAIYVSFTLYEVRRRAARRLEQSLGSAVADQMAGVRRHDHAVQAATQRQRALARAGAPDADQNTPPQMSSDAKGERSPLSDVVAAQAAAAQVAAQAAACTSEGRREGLLDFAAARLCDFDETVKEHEA